MDHSSNLLVPHGNPTAPKVVLRERAYSALMRAVRISTPSAAAGALTGSVWEPGGEEWITVEAAEAIELVSTDSGPALDRMEWWKLRSQLAAAGSSGTRIVGWYYAHPEIAGQDGGSPAVAALRSGKSASAGAGSGSMKDLDIDFAWAQQTLLPEARLLLLVDPSAEQGAFYVWQDGRFEPVGGFYEALHKEKAPSAIPWNGDIPGLPGLAGPSGPVLVTPPAPTPTPSPTPQETTTQEATALDAPSLPAAEPAEAPQAASPQAATAATQTAGRQRKPRGKQQKAAAAVSEPPQQQEAPEQREAPEQQGTPEQQGAPVQGPQFPVLRADPVQVLLDLAQRFSSHDNWGSALETYRRALSIAPVGSDLAKELEQTISKLEARQQAEKPAAPLPPVAGGRGGSRTAPTGSEDEAEVDDAGLARLFDTGLAAYRRDEWLRAQQPLALLVRQQPDYERHGQTAAELLELTMLFGAGLAAYEHGDWAEAQEALDQAMGRQLDERHRQLAAGLLVEIRTRQFEGRGAASAGGRARAVGVMSAAPGGLDSAKSGGWSADLGRVGLGVGALVLLILLVLLGVLVLRTPAPATEPLPAVTGANTPTRMAQASPLTAGETATAPTPTASRPGGMPASSPGGVLAPGPTATPAAVVVHTSLKAPPSPSPRPASPTPQPPSPIPQPASPAPRQPSPTPVSVVQALVARVAAAEAALRTGQFDATIDSGGSHSTAQVGFDVGDEQRPSRFHIRATYKGSSPTETVTERILIGERAWQRRPDGKWEPIPEQEGAKGQIQTYLPHVASAPNPTVKGAGKTTTLGWYNPGSDADVTLLVDPPTGVPRQMRQVTRKNGSILTVNYTGWNTPVEITPPPAP